MTQTINIQGDTKNRELVITRLLNAPRELVYKVWTDPKHIIQWWGPNGFTNTIHEMDVRPGGVWRFMMHGPGGMDFPNKITYTEVVKNEKLVYFHGSDLENEDEHDPHMFHVTVTFAEEGKKTLVTMKSIFPTAEALEAVKKFGAVEGGIQTINKLEDYLAKM